MFNSHTSKYAIIKSEFVLSYPLYLKGMLLQVVTEYAHGGHGYTSMTLHRSCKGFENDNRKWDIRREHMLNTTVRDYKKSLERK